MPVITDTVVSKAGLLGLVELVIYLYIPFQLQLLFIPPRAPAAGRPRLRFETCEGSVNDSCM